MCHGCEIREQRIVLSPRTVLNGGERGQEQVREAKKQRRRLKIRPRTNLNGGDLVRSTFLVLSFTFTLAFMATLVLALILAFLSPLGAASLPFWGATVKKRSVLNLGRGIPFGAFGWAFARAHCDLKRRFAFHWSWLKAGINCARRGSRGGWSPCTRGWLSQWGARMHTNRTRTIFFFSCIAGRVRESTTGSLSRKENKLDAQIPLEPKATDSKPKPSTKRVVKFTKSTHMINGVLLLGFQCPNAQTLAT